ncbi:NB-ARC domain-containing protein [Dactylosporangium sp. NPDC051541]|uniref:NB-ARC domain-containing protein n=1 Tax=Dactylosporangium sp. NPDC051541 TaxID=3363977 RepID=UPI0037BC91B8
MRKRANTSVVVVLVCTILLTNLLAVAINAATASSQPWPYGLSVIQRKPYIAAGLLTLAQIIIGAVSVWSSRGRSRPDGDAPSPDIRPLPEWVVTRSEETEGLVRALRKKRGKKSIAITTGLVGAGGFGKTTLAMAVCVDDRVKKHFGGRIYQITMGRDVRDPVAIASKVNEVSEFICGSRPNFTEPRLAGQRLGEILDSNPRALLLIDDIWEPEQLDPFLYGGQQCVRLITTRVPKTLPADTFRVTVDQMSFEQARKLLTWRLPKLDRQVVNELLEVTGRWPLLLRLVNSIIVEQANLTGAPTDAAKALLARLVREGPSAADKVNNARRRSSVSLDLNVPEQRAKAVRATVEAGTTLLDLDGADRLAELSIFPEDELIEVRTICHLWKATAQYNDEASLNLCRRLAELSLVSLSGNSDDLRISLHDVVRAFLREDLGADLGAEANRSYLTESGRLLPNEPSLEFNDKQLTGWWHLTERESYLENNLIYHMIEGSLAADALEIAVDLRWLSFRLSRSGIAAALTDLASAQPYAISADFLRRVKYVRRSLVRAADLFNPTEPTWSLTDILVGRVQEDPEWEPIAHAMQNMLLRPHLRNRWPLPDFPEPNLLQTLRDNSEALLTLASDGRAKLIASAGKDGRIRVWSSTTGRLRLTIDSTGGWIRALRFAMGGRWLVSGCDDGNVRIHDMVEGGIKRVISPGSGWIYALAVAPDDSWIAASSRNGVTHVWDTDRWEALNSIEDDFDNVLALVSTPDSARLILGGSGGSVRVLNLGDGSIESLQESTGSPVLTASVSSNGEWIAAADSTGLVRFWEVSTGRIEKIDGIAQEAVLGIAFVNENKWIALAGELGSIRIFDLAAQNLVMQLSGHLGPTSGIVAIESTDWLATSSGDGTVKIWDFGGLQTAGERITRQSRPALSVALARDGSWISSSGYDGKVLNWNVESEAPISRLDDLGSNAVLSTNGTVLAALCDNGVVYVWKATSKSVTRLGGEGAISTSAIAWSRDGSKVAIGTARGNVVICELEGMRRIATYRVRGGVLSLSFSNDSSMVAVSHGQAIDFIAISNGIARTSLTRHGGRAVYIEMGADEWSLAAVTGDGRAYVYDLPEEQPIGLSMPTRRSFSSLIGSKTGNQWAAATLDGAVCLFSRRNPRIPVWLTAHDGQVTDMAYTYDDEYLATVGRDGVVRVWATKTGECRAMLRVYGSLNSVCWSKDGHLIGVAGQGGTYLLQFREK